MIEFSDFKKTLYREIYSKTPIPQHLVERLYNNFTTTIEHVNSHAKDSFKENNLDFNNFIQTDFYGDVLKEALDRFIQDELMEKRLNKDGFCLKSLLLNRACCLIHHPQNVLGVIRGIDETNPRFLMVDFGEVEDRKVDIDELIIAGIS